LRGALRLRGGFTTIVSLDLLAMSYPL